LSNIGNNFAALASNVRQKLPAESKDTA
jgi:hypothetical protein